MLNCEKFNYMLFTRSKSNFSTRLKLNSSNLQKVESMKLLGVRITENLDWETNTRELCKKSYAQLSLLCKLKFIGMNLKDLVIVYIAYIRSILEYCCVVWSSSLTIAQDEALERVQKVSLKVILGPVYVNYQSALSVLELETLRIRREKLCLSFAKKCLKSQRHSALFPVEPVTHNHQLRNVELFTVNYARTEKQKIYYSLYAEKIKLPV